MTRFVLATVAASTLASAASAGFTGYSVQRTITAGGNSQYQVFANFDQSNLVFLNAFSFVNNSGTMNARHQDAFVADGEVGTWTAGTSIASAADRAEDSWVTASGLATNSGWGTALDPGFANGGTVGDINNGAGWYDATPGTANTIGAGGTQGGYRILIAQIVRSGDDSTQAVSNHSLQLSWKVAGTTTAIFGNGSFTIGVPAPGAMALLGLAGLAGRRRR
jgi:hypothetical protein